MRKPRFIPLESLFAHRPPIQYCEQEGCEEKGDFKAPKSPDNLRDYYWFCLEHVRQYNKEWDFYRGMNTQEIEKSRVSDVTWNRPSWPVGSWRPFLEKLQAFEKSGPFMKEEKAPPSLPQDVYKALAILEVGFPLTLQVLRQQYKKLVKKSHPDLHAGDKKAEERFKLVNEAYQVLKKYLEGASL